MSRAGSVREWLEAYRKEDEDLDDLLDRIRELRSSTGPKAQELTLELKSHSSNGDLMGDYVIRLENLEGAASRRLAEHQRNREAILSLIGKYKRLEEQEVIKARYLYRMEWPDVQRRIYGGLEDYRLNQDKYNRRMYRAHNRMLEWMGKNWEKK